MPRDLREARWQAGAGRAEGTPGGARGTHPLYREGVRWSVSGWAARGVHFAPTEPPGSESSLPNTCVCRRIKPIYVDYRLYFCFALDTGATPPPTPSFSRPFAGVERRCPWLGGFEPWPNSTLTTTQATHGNSLPPRHRVEAGEWFCSHVHTHPTPRSVRTSARLGRGRDPRVDPGFLPCSRCGGGRAGGALGEEEGIRTSPSFSQVARTPSLATRKPLEPEHWLSGRGGLPPQEPPPVLGRASSIPLRFQRSRRRKEPGHSLPPPPPGVGQKPREAPGGFLPNMLERASEAASLQAGLPEPFEQEQLTPQSHFVICTLADQRLTHAPTPCYFQSRPSSHTPPLAWLCSGQDRRNSLLVAGGLPEMRRCCLLVDGLRPAQIRGGAAGLAGTGASKAQMGALSFTTVEPLHPPPTPSSPLTGESP